MQVLQSKTLIMKCSKTRPAGSKKAPKGICTDRKTGTGKADDEEKVHFWWGGLWQHNLHRWEQGHGTGEVMIISDGGTAPSQAYVWWSAVWGESLTYGAERGKRRKKPYLSLLIVLWNVQNQNPSELQKIIAEVNATHLDPQDILSDSLYYYNPQLKKIVIVWWRMERFVNKK